MFCGSARGWIGCELRSRVLTAMCPLCSLLQVVKERSTLFFGKRFVFAEENHLQRMKQAVELAGKYTLAELLFAAAIFHETSSLVKRHLC